MKSIFVIGNEYAFENTVYQYAFFTREEAETFVKDNMGKKIDSVVTPGFFFQIGTNTTIDEIAVWKGK